MRRMIFAWLVLAALCLGQNTYYVKTGGSDAADGLSDGTAWATIGKATSTSRGTRWKNSPPASVC